MTRPTIYIHRLIESIRKDNLIKAIKQFANDKDYNVKIINDSIQVNNVSEHDILIIWNRHLNQDEIAQKFEVQGALVVLFENAYIKVEGKEYYSVGIGYHNDIKYSVEPPSLTAERFETFNRPIQPYRQYGSYFLYTTQAKKFDGEGIGYNRQPAGFDTQVCAAMKDKPFVFRTHPNSNGDYTELSKDDALIVSNGKETPIEVDLEGAVCTLVYTSNAATDSLLAGVPVIYCGKTIFLEYLCNRGLKSLNAPFKYSDEREEFFAEIAWSQYNLEEIANGYMFNLLIDFPM